MVLEVALMYIPGAPELALIFLIAIFLFGASKLPKLARSTGEAIGEFEKGRQELEDELNEIQTETQTQETTDTEETTDTDQGN